MTKWMAASYDKYFQIKWHDLEYIDVIAPKIFKDKRKQFEFTHMGKKG